MTRLTADPTALPATATAIRQAADTAASAASEHRSLPLASLTDPTLVAAVTHFVERWSPGLHDLADDAHRLADALDAAAALYRDVDSAAQAAFRAPANPAEGAQPSLGAAP